MPPQAPADADVTSAPVACLVDLIRGASDVNRAPLDAAIAAVELLDAAYRSAARDGHPALVADPVR